MSYCTRADLEARLSAGTIAILADPDQDGDEEAQAVAKAIGDIDQLINAALALRWTRYLGATSSFLTMIAVDLVIGRLARGLARTVEIQEREEKAERRLRDIQEGRLHPSPDSESSSAESLVEFAPSRKVFHGGGY